MEGVAEVAVRSLFIAFQRRNNDEGRTSAPAAIPPNAHLEK